MNTKIMKKIITFILVITFVFSPVLAIPTQAQWVDISTMAKDYGLDALAFQIVNTIIKRISASTVNWINSGFKGSPAYVTNPEAYFGNISDKVAGDYIFRNQNLNFLCGPISAKIRLALQKNYVGDNDRWRCTLTGIGRNMDDFMGDFEKGGWDSFFEISQRQQNNPIGAYLQAENEMMQKIANKVNIKTADLNQGSGFLSYKKCKKYYNWSINTPTPQCEIEETTTPGKVVSDKLNSVLGQSEGRLQMADEINEMISALISQLTEKLIGGAIGGLKSLSNPDPTDGNQTFTDQMITSTSTTDYFGNAPDTSVLDVPIPTTIPGIDTPIKVDIGNGSTNNTTCDPATQSCPTP